LFQTPQEDETASRLGGVARGSSDVEILFRIGGTMRGDKTECPYCRKPFAKRNEQHIYCCASCKVRAHREGTYKEILSSLDEISTAAEKARNAIAKLSRTRIEKTKIDPT
jgi:ribosomal protein L37AE/L43A